jgi:FkbM family methyltransferase
MTFLVESINVSDNSQFLQKLEMLQPDGHDFKMLTDASHFSHYKHNAYEKYSAEILLTRCSDGGTFIDIGAHHGFYTLLVAALYKQCNVIAFEPVPENYKILNENIRLNNILNTTTHNLAVSDRDETLDFKVAENSSRSSFYDRSESLIVETIKVKTICLDNMLNNIPSQPLVIKIDTEGHEFSVLKGMANLLGGNEDVTLILEFNPSMLKQANQRPEELLKFIASLDFDVYFIDDERAQTFKLDHEQFAKWHKYFNDGNFLKDYFNVLCVKKTRSLSICLFSHSSLLEGAERSLLEIVRNFTTFYHVLCSVVLPKEGPLKTRLEEVGASTIIIDYTWWCNNSAFIDDKINEQLGTNFSSIVSNLNVIRKINPDIILTNTIVIPWGALTAHFLNKPQIWFIREFGEADHDLKFFKNIEYIIKIIKESSNIILVNSRAVGNALFGPDIPDNIFIHYPDVRIPLDSTETITEHYFTNNESIKLIVFGRITGKKGQLDAVLAVNELIQRKQNVELVIMGQANPTYLEQLHQTVIHNNLESYVHFVGSTDNPYPIVNQADIVLTCSQHEAFGRVVLEGMLLKKPVIGTNSGGIPEQISEGYNGFLYEPGNYIQLAEKIEYFIQNKEKLTQFGLNGFGFAQRNFVNNSSNEVLVNRLRKLKGANNIASTSLSQFIEQIALYSIFQGKSIIDSKNEMLKTQEENIRSIYYSWSWRITKPIRILGSVIKMISVQRIMNCAKYVLHGQFGKIISGLRLMLKSYN